MTTILLISLVVCFFIQLTLGRAGVHVMDIFALSREGLRSHRYWQLLTFQFMHGGIFHLLGNGVTLYFFGRVVEDMMGSKSMLILYLLSGTVGGLFEVAFSFIVPEGGVVGASAGVFGLVAAFAIRAPEQPVSFLLIPVAFPAKWLLLGEGVIAIAGLLFPVDSTANAAHLGGMITGIVFARGTRWSFGGLQSFPRRRPSKESVSAASARTWRRPRKNEESGGGDFISREVDPILEKISAHGIHSLTDRERQILESARKKMAKR